MGYKKSHKINKQMKKFSVFHSNFQHICTSSGKVDNKKVQPFHEGNPGNIWNINMEKFPKTNSSSNKFKLKTITDDILE